MLNFWNFLWFNLIPEYPESENESHSVVSNSLWPSGLGLYGPWNSPGQNTGIFSTQGLNPGWILYQLNHKGKPKNTGMGSLSLFRSSIPGFGRSTGERSRLPTPVFLGFSCGLASKESALGSVLGLGLSPGEGKVYPLQYPDLENSMDCKVHGVAKSQTYMTEQLSLHFTSPILLLFSLNPFGSLFFM